MSDLPPGARLHEWKYWHVDRKTQKFIPWLARNLPTRVKYYVVIDGMCKVEPNKNPDDVTGMQMLELWNPAKEPAA